MVSRKTKRIIAILTTALTIAAISAVTTNCLIQNHHEDINNDQNQPETSVIAKEKDITETQENKKENSRQNAPEVYAIIPNKDAQPKSENKNQNTTSETQDNNTIGVISESKEEEQVGNSETAESKGVANSNEGESENNKISEKNEEKGANVDASETQNSHDDEMSEIEREIAADKAKQYSQRSGRPTAGDPNKGGYPYSDRCPEQKDAFADQWGMYICESVSYAAWKVYSTYGYMPYWGGHGSAKQWPANARAAGYTVSSTPKAGSVGISMGGAYGHAVWVEAVSGDRVYISQYNVRNAATNNRAGEYSEQWVDQGMYQYIYFTKIEAQSANE